MTVRSRVLLPVCGPCGHAEVAAGARQVGDQRVAALVEGPVDDADGHAEGSCLLALGVVAACHVLGLGGQHLVEGGRDVQRGQPDAAGGRAAAHQAPVGGLQEGELLLLPLGRIGLDGHDGPGGRDVAGAVRHGHAAALRARGVAAPGLVGPGDVRGLEAGEGGGVALEVAVARGGRQLVGVGDAEDAAALHGGEGAQSDAVGQV